MACPETQSGLDPDSALPAATVGNQFNCLGFVLHLPPILFSLERG